VKKIDELIKFEPVGIPNSLLPLPKPRQTIPLIKKGIRDAIFYFFFEKKMANKKNLKKKKKNRQLTGRSD